MYDFKKKYEYTVLAEDDYSLDKCNNCIFSQKLEKGRYCEVQGFDETIDDNGKCKLWNRK